MILAIKTLKAIEDAIQKDQGNKYKSLLKDLIINSGDIFDQKEDSFRSHLGMAQIGKECSRQIWYNFRWVKKQELKGKTIRLFNRGHLEEPRLIALIKCIEGCEFYQLDENGKQFRIFQYGGHFGSAIDGVMTGCPDIPDRPIITEFKTHNQRSFDKLVVEGVKKSKWEHFIQMNMYMGEFELTHALYLACNKNTDELYGEIVKFDQEQFLKTHKRAKDIIFSNEPPLKINSSPGWWQCKYCGIKDICHGNESPEKNCRTCEHSYARENGSWFCQKHHVVLNKEFQVTGCVDWAMIEKIKS